MEGKMGDRLNAANFYEGYLNDAFGKHLRVEEPKADF